MAKGLGNMMKQAQQMQQKMARIQEDVAKQEIEASAGGGMVTVVINGKQEILSIKIDPSVVDPQDVDMLQDLILVAINDAVRKSQDVMQREMSKLTGGMNIPGLF